MTINMDIHFQSAGVSPDALTPKLGVVVCMGKGGVSIPHCTEKKPRKNAKSLISTK